MGLKIECIHCRDCFETDEITISNETIPNFDTQEEVIDFAEESGVRFDCPSCGEVQYLSDCEIF